MTNLELWRHYNKDIPTPSAWIDWGFFFIISAALQRRVWFSGGPWALYPNIYVSLVGPPGVGKGMILKPVKDVLTYYKFDPAKQAIMAARDMELMSKVDAADFQTTVISAILDESKNGTPKEKTEFKEEKLLFPMAADATSFEALVRSMSKCTRWAPYKEQLPDGKVQAKKYFRCSTFFALEEISSLFEKHADKTQEFLLQAYDCSPEYKRETITRQTELIKRPCLSFIGGTRPDFIKRGFDANLFTSGFSSRTFFLWGAASRFKKLLIPAPDEEQLNGLRKILTHVKAISEIFGQMRFEEGAYEKIKDWWETTDTTTNKNPKLASYYERKNIHALKMAIIVHFCDKTDMVITKDDIDAALNILEAAERDMHMALRVAGRNPLAEISAVICTYIRKELFVDKEQLLIKFWEDVDVVELDKILDFLLNTKRISIVKNNRGQSGFGPNTNMRIVSDDDDFEYSGSGIDLHKGKFSAG